MCKKKTNTGNLVMVNSNLKSLNFNQIFVDNFAPHNWKY